MSRLGPLIGYHGCEKSVAEKVLSGESTLNPSVNEYDWLGPGIYFWIDSHVRAKDWAEEQQRRNGWEEAAVVGAFIDAKFSLNITDYGNRTVLIETYEHLKKTLALDNRTLPVNKVDVDGYSMKRFLDCAVINWLHTLRSQNNETPFDSVHGFFEEGKPLYTGSGFKEKTHVQIAVRDPNIILGYFRVK